MWNKKEIRQAMKVYAVTDSAWLDGRTLEACVEEALQGGATFVQLREKHLSTEELVGLARRIAPLCTRAGVPFVIDDDVEAARLAGVDGVHVGQSDEECATARATLGSHAIVGVSAQTVEQALAAQAAGADYLGVGAVFSTSTKLDADTVSFDELSAICEAVDIPVVAIGGIGCANVGELAGTGIDGVAVVSAIFAADDIVSATRNLISEVDATLG